MNDAMRSYLSDLTRGASLRTIAARVGMTSSTLIRQLDHEVKATTLVAIARAYGAPVGPAFVAAGYFTPEEVGEVPTALALRDATDRQLAEEILRRVVEGSASNALTEPIEVDVVTPRRRRSSRGVA